MKLTDFGQKISAHANAKKWSVGARQNVRQLDTMVQIDGTIRGLFGKRLGYKDLISGSDGSLHCMRAKK